MIKRVPERPPGGELVHLGPEHGNERVPAVIAAVTAEREIGEEREPFRLRR